MKKGLSILLLLVSVFAYGQQTITVTGGGAGTGAPSNLAIGVRTISTLPITNSNGTGFTLPLFGTNAGLAPGIAFPDGTQFLRDDGTWQTPPGGETNLLIAGFTATTFDIQNSNGFGVTIPAFTATDPGIVRESGGGTTNFLRADNTWAAPPAGGGGTVTSVSVTSANGLSGSVTNATTTPAITLSTTVTGILKGNGISISAATLGIDYGNVTEGATQTLDQKRINPRYAANTTQTTYTPDISVVDAYGITALASALTINAPTGSPVDFNKFILRIRDNGTARALTWNAIFRAVGVTLPTTTTAGKTMYIGLIWNASETFWDVVSVQTQP